MSCHVMSCHRCTELEACWNSPLVCPATGMIKGTFAGFRPTSLVMKKGTSSCLGDFYFGPLRAPATTDHQTTGEYILD